MSTAKVHIECNGDEVIVRTLRTYETHAPRYIVLSTLSPTQMAAGKNIMPYKEKNSNTTCRHSWVNSDKTGYLRNEFIPMFCNKPLLHLFQLLGTKHKHMIAYPDVSSVWLQQRYDWILLYPLSCFTCFYIVSSIKDAILT